MSSRCRYEVLAHCEDVRFARLGFPIADPCQPAVSSGCSSGCDSCSSGYSEGIPYNGQYNGQINGNLQSRVATLPPMPTMMSPTLMPPPPMPYTSNSVIHASYLEPTAPAVRFVQPR
jgi:hypothetical protein